MSKLNSIFFLCNVALLGGGAYLLWQARAPVPQAEAAPLPVRDETAATPEPAVVREVVTVTNDFRWRQIESEDYRAYIERLRAIGCPEQTIRDIVIADLDKLMSPRLEAVQGRRADLEFWHSEEEELANERDPRAMLRAQREVDREKRAVIEELLGVDLVRERMRLKGEQDYYERRLGFLPEDRRSGVRKILERYEELEETIRDKEWSGEPLSMQDRAELRKIQQQREAELEVFLDPTEREQYALWMSETANAVRRATYGMDITKEEFLVIYNARKLFDEQWSSGEPGLMDEATQQRWQAAEHDMEADLKRQLGPERFAEYERGQDPDFHQLSATAARFKLPQDTAKKVYEVKRGLIDIRQMLDSNPSLSGEQRQHALKALQEESERTMRVLLGEGAYRYYLRTGDASWLHGRS